MSSRQENAKIALEEILARAHREHGDAFMAAQKVFDLAVQEMDDLRAARIMSAKNDYSEGRKPKWVRHA